MRVGAVRRVWRKSGPYRRTLRHLQVTEQGSVGKGPEPAGDQEEEGRTL